jgi:MSHA biogenesis protein MshK
MADRLMLAQSVAAAAALALSAGSAAQALTDPTRPPRELMSAAADGAPARTPLQSILLSSARKGAIINGQFVALGGTYGKAKLVKITATEVTLKSDQGLEVLQLYPPTEKASVASGTQGRSGKTARRP